MHLGFGPLLRPWNRHFPFAFSPSPTGRRMASERCECGIAPPPRSDVKHRDDNADHRRNHRANSNVENPARVIKTLFFSRYMLKFSFVPFNVFFSEPFSAKSLLELAA